MQIGRYGVCVLKDFLLKSKIFNLKFLSGRWYGASVLVLGFVVFVLGSARADVLVMTDGSKMAGEVTSGGSDYEVKTDHGTFWVDKSKVKKIYKAPIEIIKDADELRKKARATYEESQKIEDAKLYNAKLKEAIKTLEVVRDRYMEARDIFDMRDYDNLDGKVQNIIMELRIYRGAARIELEPVKKPDPKPEPRPEPVEGPEPVAKGPALKERLKPLLDGGQLDKAVEQYEKWRRDGEEVGELKPMLGQSFFVRGKKAWDDSKSEDDAKKSMADIRQSLKFDPDGTESKTLLVEILLGFAGNTQSLNEATKYLTEVVEMASELQSADADSAQVALALGKGYHLRAMATMKKHLASLNRVAHLIRDDCSRAQEQYSKALNMKATPDQKKEAQSGLDRVKKALDDLAHPRRK